MNDIPVDTLWERLQVIFESVVGSVVLKDNMILHRIGKSNNEKFLLRAYLSFMKSRDGDEISITVDIVNRNNQLFIESDICNDEGVVFVDGPSISTNELTEDILRDWLGEFELFLNKNQEKLRSHVLALE